MNQKNYWTNIILDWESSSFNKKNKNISFIERIAGLFRGTIRNRRKIALEYIKKVKPKNILELGCGSGDFAIQLLSNKNIKKIYAFDIASTAIDLANKKRGMKRLEKRLAFYCKSINQINFTKYKNIDMVIGLGLTPYLTKKELNKIINFSKNKKYFIDFHLKTLSLQNLLHWIYRKIKNDPFPFYRRYSKNEIFENLENLDMRNFKLKTSKGVTYITR